MKKQFRITLNGRTYEVEAEMIGDDLPPSAPPSGGGRKPARSAGAAVPAPGPAKPAAPAGGSGDVPSPLAGKVVSVDVAMGDQVTEGQTIITLEAMKMNTVVTAPSEGTVKKIHVAAGDAVEEGQALLLIE